MVLNKPFDWYFMWILISLNCIYFILCEKSKVNVNKDVCIPINSVPSYTPIPNPHICTSLIFARNIINTTTTTTYICSFCQFIGIVPDISLHNY